MQKGDKARVINDCAVKAGSEVEVVGAIQHYPKAVSETFVACYFNNICVEIEESNLEVIKPKRWEPEAGGEYYYLNINGGFTQRKWTGSWEDEVAYVNYGCYKTQKDASVMRAKIRALVTSEIGDC